MPHLQPVRARAFQRLVRDFGLTASARQRLNEMPAQCAPTRRVGVRVPSKQS